MELIDTTYKSKFEYQTDLVWPHQFEINDPIWEAVAQFMTLGQQDWPMPSQDLDESELGRNFVGFDHELHIFRMRLINEDLKETEAAIKKRNKIETLDGLMDLLYVIYGTYIAFGRGIAPGELIATEHPDDCRRGCKNWLLNSHQHINPAIRFQWKWMTDNLLPCAKTAMRNYKKTGKTTHLDQFVQYIVAACRTSGIPLGLAFGCVHASNLTKFVKATDGCLYPLKRADGKVMKPETYFEVTPWLKDVLRDPEHEPVHDRVHPVTGEIETMMPGAIIETMSPDHLGTYLYRNFAAIKGD